ncbi:MAG: hypothetical protein M3Y57_18850 [Acidobacteriota bacterium]|nr:hypothetical protein [Acidobacteriota bacterium]
MNPRTIRRTAERKALKQAQTTERDLASMNPADRPKTAPADSFATRMGAALDAAKTVTKSRITERRLAINRANAQHSTGATTLEGKAASCLNNTKFGLTGARFTVLAWEDRAAFDQLLSDLRNEHQPATPTEQILVQDMAQHHWLSQRALLLQNMCFDIDEPACESEAQQKNLALYIRYQPTHQRAFHKNLDQLLKLRASKEKEARGFESQQQKQAEELHREETHHIRVRIAKARAECLESQNTRQTVVSAAPREAIPDLPATPGILSGAAF